MTLDALDPRSVVGKIAAITEVLATANGSIGLSEIARLSCVSKSTTYRLLGDLVTWGIVERNADRYRLGGHLYDLGLRAPARRRLRDSALPFMEDLFVASGHTVHLAVLDVDELLYVERITGHQSVPTPSHVADRMPLHCTATGKILLAFSPPELFNAVVARGLERRTNQTIDDPDALAIELAEIRRVGISLERDELVDGFSSIAAPLHALAGPIAGAISVTTATDRLDVHRSARLLQKACLGVNRRLGGPTTWPPTPRLNGERASDRLAVAQ